MTNIFNEYIQNIAKVKGQTEHSGRTYMQNLLLKIKEEEGNDIEIVQEAKSQKGIDGNNLGTPDFRFTRSADTKNNTSFDQQSSVNNPSLTIGYLETKKIGEDLNKVLKSKQIEKYKSLTDNLILTDYLRWIWINNGEVKDDVRLCEISELEKSKIKLNEENCAKVLKLIKAFYLQNPKPITSVNVLAKALAKPSAYIKEGIEEELIKQKEEKTGQLYNIYNTFVENIISELEIPDFADVFTQTFVYSLFIAKLSSPDDVKLNIYNIKRYFPSQFELISDLATFFTHIDDEKYSQIKPFVSTVMQIINNINREDLQRKLNIHEAEDQEKDPYIYFYEDFLQEYDKKIKKDRGVYYTPPSVVKYIVSNIDQVVKEEFGIEDGIGATGIKILDFAAGTGTFMLELYKQVLKNIPKDAIGNKGKTGIIANHLLKEVFGFELMIAPYCIAHLRLSQFLKEEGFDFTKKQTAEKQRIPVYLTNTLENVIKEVKITNQNNGMFEFMSFIEAVQKEGKKAQQVKDKEQIFIIMGNPPYKGHGMTQNNYINQLITGKDKKGEYIEDGYYHIEGKSIKERNPKWLKDDYVKFIRFAESKIAEQPNGGVIGIITPHSFLDNPTFRGMRYHLTKTFDKIYLLDLHGNARKKETAKDGTKDQNVFDIMTGVCISLFIKNPNKSKKEQNPTECQIYRKDLYGTREYKFKVLKNNINTKQWQQIKPTAPFYLFKQEDEKLKEEYNIGWSLRDVFMETNTGIVSKRDKVAFHHSKEEIKKVVQDIYDLNLSEIKSKYNMVNWDSRDGKVEFCKKDIVNVGIKDEKFIKCTYRPFDERYTYYTGNGRGFIGWPVYNIMQHMLNGSNVGLIVCRSAVGQPSWQEVIMVNSIYEFGIIATRPGNGSYLHPLYLYHNNMGVVVKEVNFKPEFIKMLKSQFGELVFNKNTEEGVSMQFGYNKGSVTPEQVLGYIYAILHSNKYRTKYLELLKIDFPKIPFNISWPVFVELSKIGQELVDAHLLNKIPKLEVGQPKKEGEEENYIMEKALYDEEKQRLYFNKSCYFANVNKETWEFKIGGYQVLDKYFKSRKGRDIESELDHISNTIKALSFSVSKMKEIDDFIKSNNLL